MHPTCFMLVFDITLVELEDPKYLGPFQVGDPDQCHLVRIQHIDINFCTRPVYRGAGMARDHQIFLNLVVVYGLHYLFFIFEQQNFLPPFVTADGIGSYQYSRISVWVVSSCSDPFYLKDRICSQPITCIDCRPLDFSHLFSKDSAKGVLLPLEFYPSEGSSKCIHLPYFEDPRQFVRIET